ncbi:2-oxo acid dehydrogenase subunit E2 [Conexibacter sp. CPCC 206217]|uniref:2-oxo acid dehydrogenase subunit E2 n=1 Tax=Conexibacter sp. CPCC 206217 TaxID=3064574 RepID=UPI00271AE605|nr:2-oxo acid dehydrogenase subunit E2 [Conexibacter sp. CPCC 206217]MDO8211082.1 2-oxo acid dehydrogenase subunit E2 [Conexibacter sp. CPCC 206217]
MIHEVVIPQLGMVSESLRVVGWLAEPGEAVEAGQGIAEVESDKATTEIPAPHAGFLRRRVVELDQELSVGDTIAIVTTTVDEPEDAGATTSGDAPGDVSGAVSGPPEPTAAPPAPTTGAEVRPPATAAAAAGGPLRALPAARRIARERGIELTEVRGTGPDATITVADVEGHAPAPAPAPAGPSSARRATARIVTESWKIPQFWVRRTVDLRAADTWLADQDATLADLLVWSCARLLPRHPDLLPDGAGAAPSIAYLVQTERALLAPTVPVDPNAPIAELAVARRAVVGRARADRLGGADVGAAAFAISNLGLSGIDAFSALVLPGHHGVLAVGRRRDEVRIEHGEVVAVPVLELVLSVDHRAVDGVQAAAFLSDLGDTLERIDA